MFVSRTGFTGAPRRPKPSLKLLVAAVVVCITGSVLAAPTFAAPANEAPLVVGLGDSFTSGVGLAELDAASRDCRRGFHSYPLLAATAMGMRGSNAACSGAEVSAITATFKGQRPQVSKLEDADYVVMTVGGNDVISMSNVFNLFWDETKVVAELEALAPQLRAAYVTVAEAAPDARVMVLAYPDFFPTTDTGSCGALISSVLPEAHRAFELLNSTIEREAVAAGVQYVDTSRAFEGHDICSSQPWATGLEDMTIALHPNESGHAALAEAVVAEIDEPSDGSGLQVEP